MSIFVRGAAPQVFSLSRAIFILIATASIIFAQNRSQLKDTPGAALVRDWNNEVMRLHGEMQADNSEAARSEFARVIALRAAALRALIQEDPGQAVSFALSAQTLAELAAALPESASDLESYGTWLGSVQRWVFDNKDNSHRTVTLIKAGEQSLELYFAGAEPSESTVGRVLKVEGLKVGATVAATTAAWAASTTNGGNAVLPATTSTSTGSCCSTTGVQNVVVLMVTFPGVTPPSYTTSQSVHDAFFGTTGYSLDGYWREASYGKTSAAGDVFGWYTLSTSYTCSATDTMRAEAITLASNAGVNFQNYTRLFIVVPDMGCGWAGAADMVPETLSSPAGSFTATTSYILWLEWGNSTNTAATIAMHEGGHNLGLNHSRSRAFSTEAVGPLGTAGTLTEYGDGFTAMSNGGQGHYDAPHKAELLNWLTSSNYQVVQSSGTWRLAPFETPSTGLQALKIQRGSGNNAWLWVEYRQPIGNYDSAYATGNVWADQVFSGAVIHYEDSFTNNSYSDLLDFTPTSVYGFYDPALAVGQTWTDPYSNVSITVQSATSSGLTLSIAYGTVPCTHANPTVSMSPANPSVLAGSTVSYTISVTNNDASGCSAGTFNLSSTQPSGWLGAFSSAALTLNPSQTASATLTETVSASALAGTYAVGSSAINGTYAGSGTANATVGNATTLTDTLSVTGSRYSVRQTVPSTAIVLNGGAAAAGASVTFTLTKANGSKVTGTATADSTGKAAWSYKLTNKDPAGTYSVVSSATYNSKTATSSPVTFSVQ